MPRHTPEERKKKKKVLTIEEREEIVRESKLKEAKRRGITKEAEQLRRDPVELLRAKESGQAFIQAREQLRSKGLSRQEATRAAISRGGEGGGDALEAQQFATTREEIGVEALEEKGFFETKEPERVQLDIEKRKGVVGFLEEELPILGGALATISAIDAETSRKRIAQILGVKNKAITETLIQDPETAREITLQLIQQDVIDEGLNSSEKFGALIELIPIIGPSVNKYARGLISNPKANVDTLVANINDLGAEATNLGEKGLKIGLKNLFLLDQLNNKEDDIIRMEQRIKLLVETSSILREDPDQVNRIETSILDAKTRIFNNQQIVAQGVISVPSDAVLTLELARKRYNRRNKL
jgi:hypothetical protein